MIQFKNRVKEVNGLSFVYEHLQLCSALGKSYLLNQGFLTDPSQIQGKLDKMERFGQFQQSHPAAIKELIVLLHDINDIRQTIQNLRSMQVVDDIELFEIKKLAYISIKVSKIFTEAGYNDSPLNDLTFVWDLLDPEKTQIPHFYIYAAYDEKLALVRKQILQTEDADEREKLSWEAARLEDAVRQRLSEMLHPYWSALENNLTLLAELDLLNAKCQLSAELHWTKPSISSNETAYQQLVQPEVQHLLQETSRKFQPIDIKLSDEPCLITGANMSGKTVLLKSLSLAQHLFQFGFYVPAQKAQIAIVDEVFCMIDDQQSERRGLSSFAVELININNILSAIKSGKRTLALVDELARTTNPEEGKKLVTAFVTMMQKYSTMSVITTHYGNLPIQCHRLRVKGLTMSAIPENISPKDLHKYMDYSLEETDATDVPTEALRIAEIFHIDNEFLELAKSN